MPPRIWIYQLRARTRAAPLHVHAKKRGGRVASQRGGTHRITIHRASAATGSARGSAAEERDTYPVTIYVINRRFVSTLRVP